MTQTIDHYLLLEKIHEGHSSCIYTGQDLNDATKLHVIVKLLKDPFPTSEQMAKLKSEYELTSSLKSDHIIKVLELTQEKNKVALIEEDFGGTALSAILKQRKLTIEESLRYAIQVCQALGYLHQANIVHKNLNPSNIVINESTGELKLIDFSIASSLTSSFSDLKNISKLEGTLAYISPEQTGRINRFVDYRTDFYALGITLYEMLTGSPPFISDDPLEILHGHLAKIPLPPQERDPSIPETLGEIVLKLLSKFVDDRYLSAYGIQVDLEECLKQWVKKRSILPFPLATQDFSLDLIIPQKIYGRNSEIKRLLESFDKAAAGTPQLFLVTGYSGIGKTSLVQEIFKPVTEKKGFFISGKFNQYQRSVPYYGFSQAFKVLARYLLAEPPDILAKWRTKLLNTLGTNVGLLLEIVPDFILILGKPAYTTGLTLEAKERQIVLTQTLLNFVKVFSQSGHPLVIFLDDLQWVDQTSLDLLGTLLRSEAMGSLFLVGAYRNNEVTATHPLMKSLEVLKEDRIAIESIVLTNLNEEDCLSLVSDALHQPPKKIKELVDLIIEKTEGNPFFFIQFLKTLHMEKLLTFNQEQNSWAWSIGDIKQKNITDNVVDLMIGRMGKLPAETHQILSLAACLGTTFDLKTLQTISEKTVNETYRILYPAIEAGFVLWVSDRRLSGEKILDSDVVVQELKFLHDKVQQAAYSLVNEAERLRQHYTIGSLFLKGLSAQEREERLFEIVDHLIYAKQLIPDQEQDNFITLNLQAGIKAKSASAYRAALFYICQGMEGLNEESWLHHYSTTLNFFRERIELEFLNTNYELSHQYFEQALQHAQTNFEKSALFVIPINQALHLSQYHESIKLGREALHLLDIFLPDEQHVVEDLETEQGIYHKKIDHQPFSELFNLPDMTNPETLLGIQLLTALLSPTFFIRNMNLRNLLNLRIINLCLDHGYARPLPRALTAYYGVGSQDKFNDKKEINISYEACKLAIDLCVQHNDMFYKAMTLFDYCNFIMPLKHHLKQSLPLYEEASILGISYGAVSSGIFSSMHKCWYEISTGMPLEKVTQEVKQTHAASLKYRQIMTQTQSEAFLLILGNLQNQAPDKNLNEAYLEEIDAKFHLSSPTLWYYCYNAFILYLHGEFEKALSYILKAKASSFYGCYKGTEQSFFHALILLRLIPSQESETQKLYKEEIAATLKRFSLWSETCPANYFHLVALIKGELGFLEGQWIDALKFYEEAAKSASENEYIQYAALAYELQGKLWQQLSMEEVAKLMLEKSAHLYKKWGATSKVQLMQEKQYSTLLASVKEDKQAYGSAIESINIDLRSLIKASQTIATEIELPKLIQKFLSITVENIGAERGVLLLKKNDQLFVEGEYNTKSNKVQHILNSLEIDTRQLPLSLINYVSKSSESVVLSNAAMDNDYNQDPYFITVKPKSVLCAPLVRQNELIGLLYFENNLTAGAFTPERLEVLQILSAPASMSIENARLYSSQKIYTSSLVQLTAGISHEINTPAAAILSLSEDLNKNYSSIIGQLFNLAIKLPESHRLEFFELCQLISRNKESKGTREERKITKELTALLVENQIPFSVSDVSQLATIGIDASNIKRLMPFLVMDLKEEVLQTLLHLGLSSHGLSDIHLGIQKIVNLVQTLKLYAHTERNEMGTTHIDMDMETTLTFLNYRLKQGVTVVKEFESIPEIKCYPTQLKQVWANLINNAIEAMKSRGQIIIRIKKVSDFIHVEIEDNGPGIPEQIRSLIFEPYFTTKMKGEGAGLGLAVIKDIVEMHKGKINVESEPGRTVFYVDIPTKLE